MWKEKGSDERCSERVGDESGYLRQYLFKLGEYLSYGSLY